MNNAGFDVVPVEMDLSSRASIRNIIAEAQKYGHRMKQLTPQEDEQLACTPTEELLDLPLLQPENIRDTLHAYQLAKWCNEKRVMAESVKWGQKEHESTPFLRELL